MPGHPASSAIASRSGLTVSAVTIDQCPGAPAGAPVTARVGGDGSSGSASAAKAVVSRAAISALVRVIRFLR